MRLFGRKKADPAKYILFRKLNEKEKLHTDPDMGVFASATRKGGKITELQRCSFDDRSAASVDEFVGYLNKSRGSPTCVFYLLPEGMADAIVLFKEINGGKITPDNVVSFAVIKISFDADKDEWVPEEFSAEGDGSAVQSHQAEQPSQ